MVHKEPRDNYRLVKYLHDLFIFSIKDIPNEQRINGALILIP